MPEQKVVKLVAEAICPHCSQKIMIAHSTMTVSVIEWVLKHEDLKDAKDAVKKRIKDSKTITEEERSNVLKWLDDSNTLFGPAEVESLLGKLLNKSSDTEEEVKIV